MFIRGLHLFEVAICVLHRIASAIGRSKSATYKVPYLKEAAKKKNRQQGSSLFSHDWTSFINVFTPAVWIKHANIKMYKCCFRCEFYYFTMYREGQYLVCILGHITCFNSDKSSTKTLGYHCVKVSLCDERWLISHLCDLDLMRPYGACSCHRSFVLIRHPLFNDIKSQQSGYSSSRPHALSHASPCGNMCLWFASTSVSVMAERRW